MVVIFYTTIKDGNQLLIERVIDVYNKNNQQKPIYNCFGNSSLILFCYSSSEIYSGDSKITYPNEIKIQKIPT